MVDSVYYQTLNTESWWLNHEPIKNETCKEEKQQTLYFIPEQNPIVYRWTLHIFYMVHSRSLVLCFILFSCVFFSFSVVDVVHPRPAIYPMLCACLSHQEMEITAGSTSKLPMLLFCCVQCSMFLCLLFSVFSVFNVYSVHALIGLFRFDPCVHTNSWIKYVNDIAF